MFYVYAETATLLVQMDKYTAGAAFCTHTLHANEDTNTPAWMRLSWWEDLQESSGSMTVCFVRLVSHTAQCCLHSHSAFPTVLIAD